MGVLVGQTRMKIQQLSRKDMRDGLCDRSRSAGLWVSGDSVQTSNQGHACGADAQENPCRLPGVMD